MVDLFLLCVDRDGNAHRQAVLADLETKAKTVIGLIFGHNFFQT